MPENLRIPAIKVHQWIDTWDSVPYSEELGKYRRKPDQHFYIFSISAIYLKRLSKIYRRTTKERRAFETNIQRKHDSERSMEIARFLKNGFPLSEISNLSFSNENEKYRMPGWLPTSIVANILVTGNKREGYSIEESDCIKLVESENTYYFQLPNKVTAEDWSPEIAPIEIIDGQHRLLSFDEKDPEFTDFELPVVAFLNLDFTWQAYLFYTINIKPKRINKSLAYDLYPLLRTSEWLEGLISEKSIYKEIRAQEIVEILWAYKKGRWCNKINLLGETGNSYNITQGSFVRNITTTFFKSSGLFLGKIIENSTPLSWNRTQQAAFIVYIWEKLFDTIIQTKPNWFMEIRNHLLPLLASAQGNGEDEDINLVLFSRYCLLTTDQGVRGYLSVVHDILLRVFSPNFFINLFQEDIE
ncbi:MAG: DGQHR domain-containing protein, partial [Bacteroidia bacterium]|nr:DGQHR domain-containing protein [Bacteroidia bacterium]